MALNATTLKNLIKSSVDSIDVDNGEITNDQVIEALANAIVTHITSSGQVIIGGGSSSGVYSIT